jgi:long-chain acyl-CoA synthetase
MALNLGSILHNSAGDFPDETAVIFNDLRLSYRQLEGLACKFANVLVSMGIQPGDRVALMMPNVPWFPVCYYGILYAGAQVVPLNILLAGEEVSYQLEDSECKTLVAFTGFAESALAGAKRQSETCRHIIGVSPQPGGDLPEPMTDFHALMNDAAPVFDMVQTMPDDTAVILYTSGTTGKPKGAELSHFNLYYNAELNSQRVVSRKDPAHRLQRGEVGLCALPLFHVFGQTGIMNALFFGGGAITLLPRFTPADALGIIQRDGVTFFCGVPTMFFALLQYPDRGEYDVSSLKYCIAGGATTPVEVLKGFQSAFGIPLMEGYGLSETSPTACLNNLDCDQRAGSIGRPIFGAEMKIFDENDQETPRGEPGEIVVRGHLVMKGYLNKPEATREAMRGGWLHTGDIGTQDADGYFFIVDRKKDMINRGGFNVYPREIEEVLYAHPDVAEAAVIAEPDEKYGEEIKAVLVLKEGVEQNTDALLAYCREHLGGHKYPRLFEFRDTLPKGPTGKILKRELR